MKELPEFTKVPPGMTAGITSLGRLWAHASERPRLDSHIKEAWDSLIAAWVDSDLPLVIRKSGMVRGAELTHTSGRRLVISDNSPAQWAYSRAFAGEIYGVNEIKDQLHRDTIPFAFATKKTEKEIMRYKCTLSTRDSVNKRGWKLCHLDAVGLSSKTLVDQFGLEDLKTHCRKLLSPSNHFVVPLDWAGLGEVPEVIDEVRKQDAA